jgi:hypothetical protein
MRTKIYLWVLLSGATLGAAGLYLNDLQSDFFGFMKECSAWGYSSDRYLAYCEGDHYGDYEHTAFYWNQESDVIRKLKEAQVLFLGNSRMQFAISNSATDAFFSQRATPISYYLMGFGFAEPYSFSARMIEKFNLKPKVVIINVDDRFFQGGYSPPAETTLNTNGERLHNILKKGKQFAHRIFCQSRPDSELCGKMNTLYRSRENGFWFTDHFRVPDITPFVVTGGLDPKKVTKDLPGARDLMSKFSDISPECVVFITIPVPKISAENAESLAKAMGASFVATSTPGESFKTLDGSHLTPEDALIWTKNTLPKFEGILKHCGVDLGI